ncbi:uncharacterized protein [Rutidosis leptorrhynchoides]|uniref:uncharacterized protein n=1 Tax=Rutidosis leptorrhynchoides TaxID=125765 RepID=UPI003A9A19B7
MKILSINIRGMGKEDANKLIWFKKLCRTEKPNFIAIQETKKKNFSDYWIEKLWGNSEFSYAFKPAVGKSGGNLLVWDTAVYTAIQVVIRESFVAVKGKWKDSSNELILVSVYGPHTDKLKRKMWADLNEILNYSSNAIWVIFGDFNEVRFESERKNCKFKKNRAELFNDFITSNCLIDVPLGGRLFTQISDDGKKLSKIDRFLMSEIFFELWPHYAEYNFGPKPIKIFDDWLNQKESESVILEAWNKTVSSKKPDCIFRDKLKNVKQDLRNKFSISQDKLNLERDNLSKEIKDWELLAESANLSDEQRTDWNTAKDNWFRKEKSRNEMLKQKSRVKWALQGDENKNPTSIKNEAHNHFRKLFSKNSDCNLKFNNWNGKTISNSDAADLELPFHENEILEAIKSCGQTKSPGPDGFNLKFFSKFWDIIKPELLNAVNYFWESGEITKGYNASFIALIPKTKDPQNFSNYRPISLIGSYYKILSKVLANRIKKTIPELIGTEQSAFIRGRYILDSVLVALESVDELKAKKIKSYIFKADFEKAFDCINWNFLLDMLSLMGFGNKWKKWIKSCLSSTSISILINGSPTDQLFPERGVRQGDPLSPFLFIIASEGLNFLLNQAVNNSIIQGVNIGSDNITVSHLQYADDTIIIGKWNKLEVRNTIKILKNFENLSGLKVNLNKSCVYGIGTTKNELTLLASWFGCKEGTLPFTYLGLPIGANMKRQSNWSPIIEKFNKRLTDWKAKTLSFGGRLTLIKSVLSSLPLYYFSLFQPPNIIINKLESIRRDFFWGGSVDNKKMAWVKWDNILLPYKLGGLNIGALKNKNWALLCKWWWRFLNDDNSLWVRVIKSIYGKSGGLGIISSVDNFNKNFIGRTWYNIINLGPSLSKLGWDFSNSFCKVIGRGNNTKFWLEPWCGPETLKDKFPRLFRLESNKMAEVAERVSWSNNEPICSWNWTSQPRGRTGSDINTLIDKIKKVTPTGNEYVQWNWTSSSDGSFTTKKCTIILTEVTNASIQSPVPTIINNLLPQKIGIFVWRAKLNKLPVRTELDKRGIDLHSVRCPVCDEDIETIEHSMLKCKVAIELWDRIRKWWTLNSINISSISETFEDKNPNISSPQGRKIWQAITWVTGYTLWKNRNECVFGRKKTSPRVLHCSRIFKLKVLNGFLLGGKKETSSG